MPKIIDQEKQQRALKDITTALKEVATVNAFLLARNPSGKYLVSFVDENNSKQHCSLFAPEKEDVDILVLNYKDHLKEKILQLAETYRIALEPSEQAMLDDITTSPEDKKESSIFSENMHTTEILS